MARKTINGKAELRDQHIKTETLPAFSFMRTLYKLLRTPTIPKSEPHDSVSDSQSSPLTPHTLRLSLFFSAAEMLKTKAFKGANVFMSRNLVPPEIFDALHDALKQNDAEVFLCCDPSRNGPDDFHIISSFDHVRTRDALNLF